MKVSKRSLIVSIAVLCVCALSLTAASFAWFSASEQAQVKELTLGVQSQSDLKIAVNPAAIASADNAYWVTTLDTDAVRAIWDAPEYIADVTPATANVCDGTFKAPTEDARKEIEDNGSIDLDDSKLEVTTGGYYKFTIYVRTTGNTKAVNYSTVGFSLKDKNLDATKTVLNAMRLGDSSSKNITSTASTGNVIVSEASQLTDLGDGYYYTQVDFYVWVEGKHADCKNANALSIYEYVNTITFGYGAEF